MEEQIKEFKACTKELVDAVHKIDTQLAVSIQQNKDFFGNNTREHTAMSNHIEDNTNTLKEHNGRLKKLEKWKYGLMGGLTVVMFLLGWMWDFLREKL